MTSRQRRDTDDRRGITQHTCTSRSGGAKRRNLGNPCAEKGMHTRLG
jgi:hypothetical protein